LLKQVLSWSAVLDTSESLVLTVPSTDILRVTPKFGSGHAPIHDCGFHDDRIGGRCESNQCEFNGLRDLANPQTNGAAFALEGSAMSAAAASLRTFRNDRFSEHMKELKK
jgi:hypothetical protein